jgi:hypothetical protein
MHGIRTQFADKVLMNRGRSRKTYKISPPLTSNPMESITRTTKKSSSGNGRISMPFSGSSEGHFIRVRSAFYLGSGPAGTMWITAM